MTQISIYVYFDKIKMIGTIYFNSCITRHWSKGKGQLFCVHLTVEKSKHISFDLFMHLNISYLENCYWCYYILVIQEEFEDTKGVIRIRKSKKNRQHNGQKKRDKWTNNDLQKFVEVTAVKCRIAIKAPIHCFNLCGGVILNSISCSFTSISVFEQFLAIYLILC